MIHINIHIYIYTYITVISKYGFRGKWKSKWKLPWWRINWKRKWNLGLSRDDLEWFEVMDTRPTGARRSGKEDSSLSPIVGVNLSPCIGMLQDLHNHAYTNAGILCARKSCATLRPRICSINSTHIHLMLATNPDK